MSLIPQTVVALAKTDQVGDENIIAGAPFSVSRRTGGTQAIYEDEAGTIEISQPTQTDDNGELKFFISQGQYRYYINLQPYDVNVNSQISGLYKILNQPEPAYDYYYDEADGPFYLIRMTNAAVDKFFNVLLFEESNVPVGATLYIRNASVTPLTLVPELGVLVNKPPSDTFDIPSGALATLICIAEDIYDLSVATDLGSGGGGGSSSSIVVKNLTTEATYTMNAADSGKFIVVNDSTDVTAVYLPEPDDGDIEVGMFWYIFRANLASGNSFIGNLGVSFLPGAQGSATLRTRGTAKFVCIAENTYMGYGDFQQE